MRIDGTSYPYQVYVPPDYTESRRWPVILFLHGSGERGTDGLLQTQVGLGDALRRLPDRYPAIVVFPQAPLDVRWPGKAAKIALESLARTEKQFRCDRERVYLTGISMGGNGAWYLAYRHPERFAAVVPVCGWFLPDQEIRRRGASSCPVTRTTPRRRSPSACARCRSGSSTAAKTR
jgi:predicted peptidase